MHQHALASLRPGGAMLDLRGTDISNPPSSGAESCKPLVPQQRPSSAWVAPTPAAASSVNEEIRRGNAMRWVAIVICRCDFSLSAGSCGFGLN